MLTILTRGRMMQSRCTRGAKAKSNSSLPLTTCTSITLDAGGGGMSLWPSKCQSSACECLDTPASSGTWPQSFHSSSMRYLMEKSHKERGRCRMNARYIVETQRVQVESQAAVVESAVHVHALIINLSLFANLSMRL